MQLCKLMKERAGGGLGRRKVGSREGVRGAAGHV